MNNVKILVWLSCVILNFSLCISIYALEEYVPKVIIEAKWGTKPGEFGIKTFKYQPPIGPKVMFVTNGGDIYILDPLNQRIQKFNQDGKYQTSINYIPTPHGDFFSECVHLEVTKDGLFLMAVPNSITGSNDILLLNRNGNLIRKFSAKEFNCEDLGILYDEKRNEYILVCGAKRELSPGNAEFYPVRKLKILPDGRTENYKETKDLYKQKFSEWRVDKHTILVKIENEQVTVKLEKKFIDKGFSLGGVTTARKDKNGNINVSIMAIPEGKDMRDMKKWKWLLYKYDKNKNLIAIIEKQKYKGLKRAYEYMDDLGNFYQICWDEEKLEEGVKIIKWVPKPK